MRKIVKIMLLIIFLAGVKLITCQEKGIVSPFLLTRLKEYERDNDFSWLIKDLTSRFLVNDNCLTVISDIFYDYVFNWQFYKQIGRTPVFKILVKHHEDLLSPNFKTLSVIQQSRRKGCSAYIILISNSEQTTRLLRFSDRYRELDTRAKYIILHDKKLFKKEMHYLWKKIVNVLFIRQYTGVSRYEFSTVPFPAPIRGVLVPKRLDTWHSGKLQKGADLFRDKTTNLDNQTLKVITFPHIPSTVKYLLHPENNDTTNIQVNYGGLEIEMLRTFSKEMNFRANIYEIPNAEREAWGRRQLNGSYSGILGEVQAGSADLALGNFLYTPYFLRLLDLSIPYTTQCFTFLTPESTTDNTWLTLLLPFQRDMWIAIVVTIIVITLLFHNLAKLQKKLSNMEFIEDDDFSFSTSSIWKYPLLILKKKAQSNTNVDTTLIMAKIEKKAIPISNDDNYDKALYQFQYLDNAFIYTVSMILLVSLPRVPKGWSFRVLKGWWWIFCLLVVTSYKASMTSILANPAPRVTIDTLDELAKALTVKAGGWGEQEKDFFLTSLDVDGRSVGKKFNVEYDTNKAIEKVAQGSFAYYENVYFLKNAKVKQKLRELGRNSSTGSELHIMKNCVISMPISIGLDKNSPLKPKVDIFIQRVLEAGLVQKWLNDVMLDTVVAEGNLNKAQINALMTLYKMYCGIVALIAGCVLASLVLILENIHWYWKVRKDPSFDKYDLDTYFARRK